MNHIRTLLLINKVKYIAPKYILLYIVRFTPWVYFLPCSSLRMFEVKIQKDLSMKYGDIKRSLKKKNWLQYSSLFLRQCNFEGLKNFVQNFLKILEEKIILKFINNLVMNLGFNKNPQIVEMFEHMRSDVGIDDFTIAVTGSGSRNLTIQTLFPVGNHLNLYESLILHTANNDLTALDNACKTLNTGLFFKCIYINPSSLEHLLSVACIFHADKTGDRIMEYFIELKDDYGDKILGTIFKVLSQNNGEFLLDRLCAAESDYDDCLLEATLNCQSPRFLVAFARYKPLYEEWIVLNMKKNPEIWVV